MGILTAKVQVHNYFFDNDDRRIFFCQHQFSPLNSFLDKDFKRIYLSKPMGRY